MNVNSKTDSNAVALDARNFGYIPKSLAREWMNELVSVKPSSIPPPIKAIIEIANTCNLDCPMCRVGQFGVNLKRTMSLSDFRNILDRLPTLNRVRLNGLGESTLLPNFGKYVEELRCRDIFVELISNGTGDLTKYEYVINSNGAIYISWDAADPLLFERLRRPAKWTQCVNTLKSIAEIANASEAAYVALLFTLQKTNVGQLAPLVEFAAKMGITKILLNVVKMDNMQWLTDDFDSIMDDCAIATNVSSEMGITLVLPEQVAGNYLRLDSARPSCGQHCTVPWEEVVIRWNGDVQVCNMFNPYTYGNIHLNDFCDIWENSFARLFRSMLNTGKAHPYCLNCVYVPSGYDIEGIKDD